jgi:hypothetical protein
VTLGTDRARALQSAASVLSRRFADKVARVSGGLSQR